MHLENALRVWAAAQQRPSKLASAFALHHPCNRKQEEMIAVRRREARKVAKREQLTLSFEL